MLAISRKPEPEPEPDVILRPVILRPLEERVDGMQPALVGDRAERAPTTRASGQAAICASWP